MQTIKKLIEGLDSKLETLFNQAVKEILTQINNESDEQERIEKLKQLDLEGKKEIRGFTKKILEALGEMEEKEKRNGKHNFEIGSNTCSYCGEYRVLLDRQVTSVILDKKSVGSIAEVTERRIDQTDFPCSENPILDYNKAKQDTISNIKKIIKELE